MLKTLFTLIAISFVSFSSMAQSFEGIINYAYTDYAVDAVTDQTITSYFGKDGSVREERFNFVDSPAKRIDIYRNDSVTVLNPKIKSGFIAPIDGIKLSYFSITKTDETELILGIKCYKYEVRRLNFLEKELYFTGEVKENGLNWIFHINMGVCLKSIIHGSDRIISKQVATKITEQKIDNKLFVTPKGYEIKLLDNRIKDSDTEKKEQPKKKKKKRNRDIIEEKEKL